jgi:hypothetical protein
MPGQADPEGAKPELEAAQLASHHYQMAGVHFVHGKRFRQALRCFRRSLKMSRLASGRTKGGGEASSDVAAAAGEVAVQASAPSTTECELFYWIGKLRLELKRDEDKACASLKAAAACPGTKAQALEALASFVLVYSSTEHIGKSPARTAEVSKLQQWVLEQARDVLPQPLQSHNQPEHLHVGTNRWMQSSSAPIGSSGEL